MEITTVDEYISVAPASQSPIRHKKWITKQQILTCCKIIHTGAGDGNRTHVASLEGWSSTIELHLHLSELE